MNLYLQLGSTIVVFALLFYSIGVITEQKTGILSKKVLTFITLGVIFDIAATILMVVGSSKNGLTFHGFIGYSSLAGMLIDAILMWTRVAKNGMGSEASLKLHKYTRYAYIWWVLAFITGALLVFL